MLFYHHLSISLTNYLWINERAFLISFIFYERHLSCPLNLQVFFYSSLRNYSFCILLVFLFNFYVSFISSSSSTHRWLYFLLFTHTWPILSIYHILHSFYSFLFLYYFELLYNISCSSFMLVSFTLPLHHIHILLLMVIL